MFCHEDAWGLIGVCVCVCLNLRCGLYMKSRLSSLCPASESQVNLFFKLLYGCFLKLYWPIRGSWEKPWVRHTHTQIKHGIFLISRQYRRRALSYARYKAKRDEERWKRWWWTLGGTSSSQHWWDRHWHCGFPPQNCGQAKEQLQQQTNPTPLPKGTAQEIIATSICLS